MSKVGKYILVSFGVVLAAIIILMVMASVFIDPNTYRQQVVELVKKQTGRDLQINGDVSLSLFPWLGIQFKEMQLDGPAGFEPAKFARLRSADIRVAALPLLWGRVDIDQILIDGLNLNLVRTKQGRDNWTFASQQPAEPKTPSEKKPAQESSAMAVIRLGSLTFKDSNILWQDNQSGASFAVKHLGLTLDRLASGELAEFSLVTDLTIAKNPPLPIAINSQLMIDWPQQIAELTAAKIELGEVVITTELKARNIFSAINVNGVVRLKKVSPRALLRTFGVSYHPANKKALKSLKGKMNFSYASEIIKLKNINLALDKAGLTGDMSIGLKNNTGYKFDLQVSNLNTDLYLPAAAEKIPAAPPKSAHTRIRKKTDKEISLPTATLRALQANGKLRLENFRGGGVGFKSIDTNLSANAGLIKLVPFNARLYEGRSRGHIIIDTRKRKPRYVIEQKIKNIQVGDLLKDLEIYKNFQGKGNFDFKLSTTGNKVSSLKKNLNGSFATKLKSGKLIGVDFIRQLREARELLETVQGKQKKHNSRTGNETVYEKLTATGKINNGVITNNDLWLTSPKLQMTGKGTIDLPKNWIYYRLKATYQEKKGIDPIKAPIKIKGPLDDPQIKVEYQKILRKEGEKRLRKEAEKALEKELRKGLENLFRR